MGEEPQARRPMLFYIINDKRETFRLFSLIRY